MTSQNAEVCDPCKGIIMTVKDSSDVLADDQKTGSTIGTKSYF